MKHPNSKADRPKRSDTKSDLVAWFKEYRTEHPLPPKTGLKADKAFFDSLSEDEPGDGQFQFTDLA